MRRILPRKRGNEPAEEIRLLQEHFARGEKKGYEQGYLIGYAKGMEAAREDMGHTLRPPSATNAAEDWMVSLPRVHWAAATQRAQVAQIFSLAHAWNIEQDMLSLRLDVRMSVTENCTMEPREYSWGRSIFIPVSFDADANIDMLQVWLPRLWHEFPGERYSLLTFLAVEFSILHEQGHSPLFYPMAQMILRFRRELLPGVAQESPRDTRP